MSFQRSDFTAGPIVRRVEPEFAAVWVALRKPATVHLRLYEGTKSATQAAQIEADAYGSVATRAVGAQLHLAVVLAKPVGMTPLKDGEVYSYNVEVEVDGVLYDLDACGLLQDVAAAPGVHPHLALGYVTGRLPSFRLPPASFEDLVLFQGSCRKTYGPRIDMMGSLDSYAREDGGEGPRPHILVLSGDQIYADSVPSELLPSITEAGNTLLSGTPEGNETVTLDLDVSGDENTEEVQVPVSQWFLPAARRQRLITRQARMSGGGNSHLLGFGEFAAMYLMCWSNTLWPADFFDIPLTARGQRVSAYKQRREALLAVLEGADELAKEQRSAAASKLDYRDGALLLPDQPRWIDGYLENDDVIADYGDEDLGAVSAQLGMPDITVPGGLSGPPAEHIAVVGGDSKMRALSRSLTPSWYAGRRHVGFSVINGESMIDDVAIIHLQRLRSFYDDLPRVRRALANVSTLMLFDDHEVTDDWNISQEWVERVNQAPLGKDILRNGILAYGLFQAWGNDPERFAALNTPEKKMLDDAEAVYMDNGSPRPVGSAPDPTAAAALEHAFDVGPGDPPLAERVRWHYEVPLGDSRIIALDTRTHRGFIAPSSPPALMVPEQIIAQIPEPGPDPQDAPILVISPAPVIGFPTIENYLQPFLNLKHRYDAAPSGIFAAIKTDYFSGVYKKDPEPWGYSDEALENLYARLAPHRRVIFLSGDVHYSCTIKLDYWAFDHDADKSTATRFVQLTGSSMRNRPEEFKVTGTHSGFGSKLTALAGTPRERLAWHRSDPPGPDPVTPPVGEEFNALVQRRLQLDPVLLPAKALPEGTGQTAPPDWAWRYDMVEDIRPESERVHNLVPPAFTSYDEDGDIRAFLHPIAERMLWQGRFGPPRVASLTNNLTRVSFEGGDTPAVIHEVINFDRGGLDPSPQPYTLYRVALDTGAEEAPTVPTGGA